MPVAHQDQEAMEEAARGIAQVLRGALPPEWGFGLVLFHFGRRGGTLSWISSAERADMKRALEELLTRWARDDAQRRPRP
jgi:hypothetical protein